jgi:hypothetical protein
MSSPRPLAEAPVPEERELWQAYYLLQYQRMAQHENGRLQVSNYVVAASVVALGALSVPKEIPPLTASVVALAVILGNAFALVYAATARRWVKAHQERAGRVLARLSPTLAALQAEADVASGVRKATEADAPSQDKRNKSPWRSQLVITYLHVLLGGCAAAVLWLTQR